MAINNDVPESISFYNIQHHTTSYVWPSEAAFRVYAGVLSCQLWGT